MANLRESVNYRRMNKEMHGLLKEGERGIVVRCGGVLSEEAKKQLLTLTQDAMRTYKTTNRSHLGVEAIVRERGKVAQGIYLFGLIMQTVPEIEESGSFSATDFENKYNKGLSGIPVAKLNMPRDEQIPPKQQVPDEPVPSELIERMRALRQKDPTYASHVINEVLPVGLMQLLKYSRVALHYRTVQQEGYAEWFKKYVQKLVQPESSNKKNRQKKVKETVLKKGEEKPVSKQDYQSGNHEKRTATAGKCRLCSFEFEADDVAIPSSGENCICLRCFNKETGNYRPMPKDLRRMVEAALANIE